MTHDPHTDRTDLRAELEEVLGEPVDAETAAEIQDTLDQEVTAAAEVAHEVCRDEAERLAAENGGESA